MNGTLASSRKYVSDTLIEKSIDKKIEKIIYNTSIRRTKQEYSLEKLTLQDERLLKMYNMLAYEYLSYVFRENKQDEVPFVLNSVIQELKDEQEEEDAFILNPVEATEGIHVCFKCGSKKAVSYQLQTRSGDEGTTTFIQCANKLCGSRWKM